MDELVIAGQRLRSRLFLGTGRYPDAESLRAAVAAAEVDVVAAALRRVDPERPRLDPLRVLADLPLRILPNTSGARTAAEAVRIARLARELTGHGWVKVEITPDEESLLPDAAETLAAAARLVREGFTVLPYIQADPVLARRLEEAGCAAVMPLGAPIGTGQGLKTRPFLEVILERARVPVIVDAGLGLPSHACAAMELGADAVLVNTAIARCGDPPRMARAFAAAVRAGRAAWLAGRAPQTRRPVPSSPAEGRLSGDT